MKTVALGAVLEFAGRPERIAQPHLETFVTVKLNCGGAVQRTIKDGKVPVAFTGYRVRAGQFVYSRIDARNGAYALVPGFLDGAVVSKDFPVFDVRDDIIDRRYLIHFMRSGQLQPQIRAVSFGATNRQRIAEDRFLSFRIPLPPLDEQRRIAAILDRADAVRSDRGRVINQLDELAPSIFLDMFGQYSGDFATVEEVAQKHKGSIRTGPFGSQLLHSEFVDEGIAVLGLDNVVGNKFGWGERRYITPEKYEALTRYTVHPGDVLVSIMGTCGRCVVVPDDIGIAINTKHICAITVDPEQVEPEFLRAAFLWHPGSRQHLSQRTKGSIMDGLNMGIVKEMPLPLPSLVEQRQFVDRLRQVEEQGVACAESAASLEGLFESLQGRAFTGQL